MVVFALLLAARIVAAGPAPDAEQVRSEAAAAFAAGSAAFDRGDFTTALAEFQRANRLVAHPKVRSNIALCLSELGRHREAIAEFETALAGAGLTADERELASTYLARSREALASLRVDADAPLVIDIDATEHCTTPCLIALDPGRHRVASVARGYVTELELGVGQSVRVAIPPGGPPPPRIDAASVPAPTRAKPVRPGALTWVGLGLAVAGGSAIVGFGLTARDLHQRYLADPEVDTRRRGVTMRNLANAAIGIASTGALLLVIDGIRMGRRARRSTRMHARVQRAW